VPLIYLPNPIDREKFSKGLKDFRNQHHQKLTYNPSSSSSRTRKDSSATKKDKGSTRQVVSPTAGINSEK
jgi:menaquinone-dependent protoporphyrinogen IX oxidase